MSRRFRRSWAQRGFRFSRLLMGRACRCRRTVLDKARMEVASKGMPQTGRLGFRAVRQAELGGE